MRRGRGGGVGIVCGVVEGVGEGLYYASETLHGCADEC